MATIVVAAVCTVLAIGAGALAATGVGADIGASVMASLSGPAASDFRSRAASTCEPGWKIDRDNRDQIHCYLTHDVARLCDPRERQALIDKLAAYQTAADRGKARELAGPLSMIGNTKVLEMGMADARSRDPRLSVQEREELQGKTMQMANGFIQPTMDAIKDNENATGKGQLAADVQLLGERGLLTTGDFFWTTPEIVKIGLARVGHVTPMECK